MDQKRLLAAIALSIGILLTFEVYNRSQNPAPVTPPPAASTAAVPLPSTPATPGGAATAPAGTSVTAAAPATPAQMVAVENPRVQGRISARGLMLESLILKDYRETIERNSPLVTLLAPRNTPEGYFGQWGWTAADGRTRVPDNDTDWTVTGGPLRPPTP